MKFNYIYVLLTLILFSCEKDLNLTGYGENNINEVVASITKTANPKVTPEKPLLIEGVFEKDGEEVSFAAADEVSLVVPFGTSLNSGMSVSMTPSLGSTISPDPSSITDFSSSIEFTVTDNKNSDRKLTLKTTIAEALKETGITSVTFDTTNYVCDVKQQVVKMEEKEKEMEGEEKEMVPVCKADKTPEYIDEIVTFKAEIGEKGTNNKIPVTFKVPKGVPLMGWKPKIVFKDTIFATSDLQTTPIDFTTSGSIDFTATAQNGDTQVYTLSAIESLSKKAEVISVKSIYFKLDGDGKPIEEDVENVCGLKTKEKVIDETKTIVAQKYGANTFVIEFPKGTDIKAVPLEIKISDCAETDITLPTPESLYDFSNPIAVTVTSEDGSSKDFTIQGFVKP